MKQIESMSMKILSWLMATGMLTRFTAGAMAQTLASGQASEGQAKPPYPPSLVIQRVSFDFGSRDRRAPGSDNWPITWADDNHQYTTWGDGGGFEGTDSDGRVSLGVARVEGTSDNYRGRNIWGGQHAENPAQFEGKSYGILSVGDILYLWVSPGSDTDNYREARLCYSTNHGGSWAPADWAFTQSDGFVLPTFCQ